jgi:hypothetical protein
MAGVLDLRCTESVPHAAAAAKRRDATRLPGSSPPAFPSRGGRAAAGSVEIGILTRLPLYGVTRVLIWPCET